MQLPTGSNTEKSFWYVPMVMSTGEGVLVDVVDSSVSIFHSWQMSFEVLAAL